MSEPDTQIYLYIYTIKLAISDCACCYGNNRMNLAPFHNSAYTGSYWPLQNDSYLLCCIA